MLAIFIYHTFEESLSFPSNFRLHKLSFHAVLRLPINHTSS